MIDQTFGRLKVLALAPRKYKNRPRYLCECFCGTQLEADHYHLRSGHTSSCGCAKLEMHIARLQTHGLSRKPEYKNWLEMRYRCLNESCAVFKHYGGRGIKIFSRWDDFPNFFADMGSKPTPKHSIDRVDVNGDYEPKNCRWATFSDQQANRRDTRKLTHNGETLCLSHWGKRFGIKQNTMHYWVVVKGLTLDEVRTKFS